LAIAAVLYVPPLRNAADAGVDALGRVFGTSVNNSIDHSVPTTAP